MKTYLVALCVGGVMENSDVSYKNYQLIDAENEEDARKKYNEINGCSYFYGKTLALVKDKTKVENILQGNMNLDTLLELFLTNVLEKCK